MKTLKSLSEHDTERYKAWDAMHPKNYNGIACPSCGTELYDETQSGVAVTLTSNPPRVPIRCASCSYHGSRLA